MWITNRLASVLGEEKVIPGTVTSSVGRRAVGISSWSECAGLVLQMVILSRKSWSAEFNAAGLNAHLSPHPLAMKWSKMLTNLPANASAAILDLTAAEVFAHPGLFRLEMDMLREALAVMKALQLKVADSARVPGAPAGSLGDPPAGFHRPPLMKKAVGGGRGGKRPPSTSTCTPAAGKSEVEWLNGAVVRHGRENHVPTPVNQVLTDTLLALTRGEIPLDTFSHQPEIAAAA